MNVHDRSYSSLTVASYCRAIIVDGKVRVSLLDGCFCGTDGVLIIRFVSDTLRKG